jgi:hypothetical protein
MCGSWPDDEWMERLTVCGDAFDRRDQSPLDISSSTVQIVPGGQYFQRAKDTSEDSRLIYIVDILL